jgi:hypothetical protein
VCSSDLLPAMETSTKKNGTVDYSYTIKAQTAADIHSNTTIIPEKTLLHQNFPNPFNPSTTISFELAAAANVKLEIFNVLGQSAAQLMNEMKSPGRHDVRFDASNLPSGTYFCRLTAGDRIEMKKMVYQK